MKSITIILLLLCTTIFAETKKTTSKKHREYEAHVHGAATLEIAFDGLNGKVEFKAAAEGILGFEYLAKTEKDKSTLAQAKSKFENIGLFIQTDTALNCRFSAQKIDQQIAVDESQHSDKKNSKNKENYHGDHSDFIAEYTVSCEKPIVGSQIKIDFTSFAKLHDLDITVLVDDIQKSLEAKRKPVVITLSNK